MRPFAELERDATDRTPFSNGTEWEMWSGRWCDRCKVDEPARVHEKYEDGCPLIVIALSGQTPAEWLEQPGFGDYHCVEFRDEKEPDANPHPEQPLPGQGELFDRDEFERPRMFQDIANEVRPTPTGGGDR